MIELPGAAIIGAEHPHIFEMTRRLRAKGVAFKALSEVPAAAVQSLFPDDAPPVMLREALLAREDIGLVLVGGVPAERAEAARQALLHGKDVLAAKPLAIDLQALNGLRAACGESRRYLTVWFSERVNSPSTQRAIQLVRNGAIGDLISIIGLGPHRLRPATRPAWTFDRKRAGGILVDLASHQIDQLLALARGPVDFIEAVANNLSHPEYPAFQDFGCCRLRSASGVEAYFRVDWLSPEGVDAWGDVRLMLQGALGTIEVRKCIDLCGLPGDNHLILADAHGVRREHVQSWDPDFFDLYLRDLMERSQKSFSQPAVFSACELSIRVQQHADAGRTAGIEPLSNLPTAWTRRSPG